MKITDKFNSVSVVNKNDLAIVSMLPSGTSQFGGNGTNGIIKLLDTNGKTRITLNAGSNYIRIYNAEGKQIAELGPNGNLVLGGNGSDGDLILKTSGGEETITMSADSGSFVAGGNGVNGDMDFLDAEGNRTVFIDGENGNITLGGTGHDGDLMLQNSSGVETIHLNGDSGDIILNNADFAEDFDVVETVTTLPGYLMVINGEGKLEPCSQPYDTRAVGVISGAGNYRPGIIMDKKNTGESRIPISLMGKVACFADAGFGPIRAGDLLTSSPKPGHVMKADPASIIPGSVVGKALSGLDSGSGMVNLLITLQ